MFCSHHKLARNNSHLVSSPALHHRLAKSLISSNLWVFFYSFSFCNNFYLESHGVRRVACFWYDEKNNSNERDTRFKCLSGYSNWEYCCVSVVFTSSLIRFFSFVYFNSLGFVSHFPMFSGRFAHSNYWFQSRISLPAYCQWFLDNTSLLEGLKLYKVSP